MILFIPSIWYNLAGAAVSDGECEDCEAEAKENEKEHSEEVKPEKARDTATSTDESGDWDEHEEDSEYDDWFVEETFAFGGCIFAEPDPGGEYWDWEKESEEIEDSEEIVATLNHFLRRK